MAFISFDGIDGAGKTSQINAVCSYLSGLGEVVRSREPGGTPLGEQLRALVLAEPMNLVTEALMLFAARQEHLVQVVKPALARGAYVVLDRFSDASFAYQVYGRGMDESVFQTLRAMVHPDLNPDLTFIFDCPPEVAARRLSGSRDALDKFEQEQTEFFDRVRAGYLELARREPGRIRVLDATKGQDEVTRLVMEYLIEFLKGRS